MSTLKNLEQFIGREWDGDIVDDIICAFEEEGEVIVNDSANNGYDKIVYINDPDSTQYLFKLEDNIITDVWEA